VVVPSGAHDPRHLRQFAFFALDGGACLIRYDDDSDEGRPDLTGVAAPANVTSVDDPTVDRDRGIFATAIALFPVAAATAPADAFGNATSRITM
jgi:hypothetical protein